MVASKVNISKRIYNKDITITHTKNKLYIKTINGDWRKFIFYVHIKDICKELSWVAYENNEGVEWLL